MDDATRKILDRHDDLLPELPPLTADDLERAYAAALMEIAEQWMGGKLLMPRKLPDGQTEYGIVDSHGHEWLASVPSASWASGYRALRWRIRDPKIEAAWPGVASKHRLPE